MTIKSIKTENDYQLAIARLELIFDATIGSAEGDELEILGILIDNYEKEHFHIEIPTAFSTIS
ncbi:hypothetical protein [Parasediminibacterium sp. JCM 36343]|uniref:hypothetical protein n=1 Tax=Parasediminibacterium sp. JCM 36343 TaxID=3374279 RepID=UPI00397986EF